MVFKKGNTGYWKDKNRSASLKKKYMLGIVVLFFMISFVSSAPPFATESLDFDEGLVIFTPLQYYFQENQEHIFNFQVFNKSNGIALTNETANCSFMLIDSDGNFDYTETHAGYTENSFKVTVGGGNFTTGHYNYGIKCITTLGEIGGMKPTDFWVTESGVEITESKSILIIGLMGILTLFLFASLYILFSVENYIAKFISYWISHIMIIIITFIGWQMGIEGMLEGMALTGIFRIMFWIFTITVIPIIIVSVAWIVYIHAYNEHFQKLIDKGEAPETAFAMTNKKKGWIFGN